MPGGDHHPHKLRVGFDVDGVFYPFVDVFREYLVSQGYERARLGPATAWAFYRDDWGMELDEWMEHFVAGVRAGVIFGPAELMEGSREAMEAIIRGGDELHIVTSRNVPSVETEARALTHAWLGSLGLAFDSVTISHDKGCVDTDVFLEDSVDNYEALAAVGETVPVLLTRAYNVEATSALRVESHGEFVALLDSLRHTLREDEQSEGVACERCEGWWSWEHYDLGLTNVCLGEPVIVGDAHPYVDLWSDGDDEGLDALDADL